MSKEKMCIYKMSDTSIQDIINLMKKDYKTVEMFEQENRVTYNNTWAIVDENRIITTIENGSESFLYSIARYEQLVSTKKFLNEVDIFPDEYLLKRQRTAEVYTYECNDDCFIIINASGTSANEVRKRLMRKDKGWETLHFKNIEEYTFRKDFYYWLLKNINVSMSVNADIDVKILEVKGFKSMTDTNHKYNGNGNTINQQVPFQTIISTDEDITSLYIRLKCNDNLIGFMLDFDGKIECDMSECRNDIMNENNFYEKEVLAINVYAFIIPWFWELYNCDEHKLTVKKKEELKRESALRVMKNLTESLEIDKDVVIEFIYG